MSGLEPPLIWTFLKRKIGQLGGNGSTQRSGSVRLTLAPEQTSTCQFPFTNIFRVKNQRWWSVWVYTNLAVKASRYRAVPSTCPALFNLLSGSCSLEIMFQFQTSFKSCFILMYKKRWNPFSSKVECLSLSTHVHEISNWIKRVCAFKWWLVPNRTFYNTLTLRSHQFK